jgi:uncharacterized membrane protein
MPSTPRTRPGSPGPLLLWARVRDSLWFVPGIGALVGIGLAALALYFPLPERWEDEWIEPFLFSGEIGSARSVLSTIAGSLITVTGVVFSVTVVTLQLASTQFTPRVMRTFIADRTNQSVLAIFIGTFTYTLIVLGALGSPAYGDDGVPVIAVSFSIVLLLVSVGALIAFINRAAQSAQVSSIFARETKHALNTIGKLFPAGVGTAAGDTFETPEGKPASVQADSGGYVQALDGIALVELADRHDLLIEMRTAVGDFLFPGKEIARVWPSASVTPEMHERIRELHATGAQRTPEQDVEFSILAIADIGVKALSTGINDPTTAYQAIDRLSEILSQLAGTSEPRVRAGRSGKPRLLARVTTFDRAVGLAFDQLRHFGAGNPGVVRRMLDSFLALLPLTGSEEAEHLRREAELLLIAARQQVPRHELPSIEELAGRVLQKDSAKSD